MSCYAGLGEWVGPDIMFTFCLETCRGFDSRGFIRIHFALTSSFSTPPTHPHPYPAKKEEKKTLLVFTLNIQAHNVARRTQLRIIGNLLLIIKMANYSLSTWVVFLVSLLRKKMILLCHNTSTCSLIHQRLWKSRKMQNDEVKEYRRLILSRSWPWAFEFL
jgi:hypothetical protein